MYDIIVDSGSNLTEDLLKKHDIPVMKRRYNRSVGQQI